MVSTGEPISAAKRALRSIPRRASSSSRSTRTKAPLGQAHGRLGGRTSRRPSAAADRVSLALERSVARDVLRREAELEPAPGAAVQAVGDLVSAQARL